MRFRWILILIVVFVIVLPILKGSLYVVKEGEQVVITQFGRPVGDPITRAGLKLKTPMIQKLHRFDKRILEWDGSPNQIPTKDKKFIWLDTTARWRIKDALTFYQALGTEEFAQSRLDDIIDSAARDAITSQVLVETVRNSNRLLGSATADAEDDEAQGIGETIERIQMGREKITQMILDKARQSMPQYGIELVDVRIKRINYVEEVQKKVFARMQSERERIAAKYKSEGEGEAADIRGQMQKELERINSEAYKKAEQIKGKADAEAIRIYAEAHNKDPEFFAFIQTLETYRKTIDKNSKLILSTKSDLYRYMKEIER